MFKVRLTAITMIVFWSSAFHQPRTPCPQSLSVNLPLFFFLYYFWDAELELCPKECRAESTLFLLDGVGIYLGCDAWHDWKWGNYHWTGRWINLYTSQRRCNEMGTEIEMRKL